MFLQYIHDVQYFWRKHILDPCFAHDVSDAQVICVREGQVVQELPLWVGQADPPFLAVAVLPGPKADLADVFTTPYQGEICASVSLFPDLPG